MNVIPKEIKNYFSKRYLNYDLVKVSKGAKEIRFIEVRRKLRGRIKFLGIPIKNKYEYIKKLNVLRFSNTIKIESVCFCNFYTIKYAINNVDKIIYWSLINTIRESDYYDYRLSIRSPS